MFKEFVPNVPKCLETSLLKLHCWTISRTWQQWAKCFKKGCFRSSFSRMSKLPSNHLILIADILPSGSLNSQTQVLDDKIIGLMELKMVWSGRLARAMAETCQASQYALRLPQASVISWAKSEIVLVQKQSYEYINLQHCFKTKSMFVNATLGGWPSSYLIGPIQGSFCPCQWKLARFRLWKQEGQSRIYDLS